MKPLWHFTCACSAALVAETGFLRPNRQPMLGGANLVWLTDAPKINPYSHGLDMVSLPCDRTEYRCAVTNHHAEPWLLVAHRYNPTAVMILNHGRTPFHWYVTGDIVPVGAVERVGRMP